MQIAPLAWLPESALGLLKEVARHLLRRPVVGVAAAVRTADGRWLLIRRGDTGTWALPGGTLEWGETLSEGLRRELLEEAGVESFTLRRVVGVFSRPDRDPRFHAVTVLVEVDVDAEAPRRPPLNRLEITDVRLFGDDAIPHPLAMKMSDLVEATRAGAGAILE